MSEATFTLKVIEDRSGEGTVVEAAFDPPVTEEEQQSGSQRLLAASAIMQAVKSAGETVVELTDDDGLEDK